MGKKLYNYLLSSDITLTDIVDWTSGCKFKTTLNVPKDLISLTGCIKDGFISILSTSDKILAISVGLTEPYSSLFSVASFITVYSLFWIFSFINFASFFFSWSFFESSFLNFSTSLIFSSEAKRAFFLKLKNFERNLF